MVQILQPFKVGHGHTTSVDVQIGNNENVPFDQDLVSRRSRRSVGSFGDDLFDAKLQKYEEQLRKVNFQQKVREY